MRSETRAFAAALFVSAFAVPTLPASAASDQISIVAAENFYGNLAEQVAGPEATVTSILSSPDQDPHMFEASIETAKSLADADVVIANGADYDPWMDDLLEASTADDRIEIIAATLMGKKAGENPHLWYDPVTMKAVAETLAETLGTIDADSKAEYQANAEKYVASLKPLTDKIAAMKAQYAGEPVTASEPVFGYMAAALGLDMINVDFQNDVMNGTEPAPADVAAFEDSIRDGKVRVLIYNAQADDAAARRLVKIANEADVPVVGVSETKPQGKSYEAWMMDQLESLDKALATAKS